MNVLFRGTSCRPIHEWWISEIGFCQFPPRRTHELTVLLRRLCGRDTHYSVIAIGTDGRAGFPAQAVRSSPALDGVNTLPKPLP
jgi:hypothetical protein